MNSITKMYYVVQMTDGKFLYIDGGSAESDPFLTTTEHFDTANRYEEKEHAKSDIEAFEGGEYDEFKNFCDKDAKFEKFVKMNVVSTLEEE